MHFLYGRGPGLEVELPVVLHSVVRPYFDNPAFAIIAFDRYMQENHAKPLSEHHNYLVYLLLRCPSVHDIAEDLRGRADLAGNSTEIAERLKEINR